MLDLVRAAFSRVQTVQSLAEGPRATAMPAGQARAASCPLLELCTDDTLLLHLLSYITAVTDLLRLALTCRRFAVKCIADAGSGAGAMGTLDAWSIVDEVARRWLVTKSEGCGWSVQRTPSHGAASWLAVMHQADEMASWCCSVCRGPLHMQCYRIRCDRGLGCEDGICAACFRSRRQFLCVGEEAPDGFGAAYSHRMIGCVSHTDGMELDDDDVASSVGVFYFCHCHEGSKGPALRRELAGLLKSDLCQRLRSSGALAPTLVPLTPGQREAMTDPQKAEREQMEKRDEESRNLLAELTSNNQLDHIVAVLVAHATGPTTT